MKALEYHSEKKWVKLYIERWLKAEVEEDGKLYRRCRGTPQGGVISPLLANLFLHYTIDAWMLREHPRTRFERYALIKGEIEHGDKILVRIVAMLTKLCR